MGFKEVAEWVKQKMNDKRESNIERDNVPDDQTKDRYLRSLRRERRTQMEMQEKIRLKKKIMDFKRTESRVNVFGINNAPPSPYNKVSVKKNVKRTIGRTGFLSKGKM